MVWVRENTMITTIENEVIDFISNELNEDIIYPGLICQVLKTDIKEMYVILEKLVLEGKVKKIYKFVCENCNGSSFQFFETIMSAEGQTCGTCSKEIDILQELIVLYQKI